MDIYDCFKCLMKGLKEYKAHHIQENKQICIKVIKIIYSNIHLFKKFDKFIKTIPQIFSNESNDRLNTKIQKRKKSFKKQ